MSANLYDILNVDESADADGIRAAWKAAVADLDPTDRRFRAFNDAAAVLLDADQRAAYDAELAAARDAAADAPAPAPAATPTSKPADTPADKPADTPADKPADGTAATPAGPPGWALGAAGVGALVAVVLAVVLLVQPGGTLFSDSSPKKVAAANARFEKAAISAEGAAERLIAPVFSYNYKTMDADLARAQEYLTPELGATQAKSWPDLSKDAADQQIVVQAKAEAAALTRVSADGRNATVMVFLVQDSTKKDVQQSPLRMWVSLDLVLASGSDDRWLVSDICVDSNCT